MTVLLRSAPRKLPLFPGVLRKFAIAGACLVVSCMAQAQHAGSWFTVMGDPAYDADDLVELNVAQVGGRGSIQTMELRVSLAKQRIMGSGEQYQSYFSHIELDCVAGTIVHRDQTRYVDARWQGKPTFQRFVEVRPMAFGGLNPNPKSTILRAACPAVQSGSSSR